MIVRGEEHVIRRCLEDVGHLIDAVAIIDTGSPSSDHTITFINEFMGKNNIPGEVISRPWYHFGPSRTEALRHGTDVIYRIEKGELYPNIIRGPPSLEDYKRLGEARRVTTYLPDDPDAYTGSGFLKEELAAHHDSPLRDIWYFMFMDADNQLRPEGCPLAMPKKFVFNKTLIKNDCYNITTVSGTTVADEYDTAWLIRYYPDKPWIWYHRRHEFVGGDGWVPNRSGRITGGLMYSGRDGARSKDPLRYLNDALILEQDILRDPNNARLVYYLAQSYKDCNHHHKAKENYLKVTQMSGWVEEIYMAYLRAGALTALLDDEDEMSIIGYYAKAAAKIPERWEAQYYIAKRFYDRRDYIIAWALAKATLERPYGGPYKIHVAVSIIDYQFYDLASICAYYCGDNEGFVKYGLLAIASKRMPEPDKERIRKNLALYARPAQNYSG